MGAQQIANFMLDTMTDTEVAEFLHRYDRGQELDISNNAGTIIGKNGDVKLYQVSNTPEASTVLVEYEEGSFYICTKKPTGEFGRGKRVESDKDICSGLNHAGNLEMPGAGKQGGVVLQFPP